MFQTIEKQGYYLIAEIGVNYYDIASKYNISNLEAAKLMCKEAKEAGADAVKFQTYKAGKIASKYSPSYWDLDEEATSSQYELFKKYDLFGYTEYKILSDYCKSISVNFLSTPFDFEAADFLYELMDYYKISSSDITNKPFIEYIAKKNKPILLSTGASTLEEVYAAVDLIRKNNDKQLVLLHCVLEYPTPYEHAVLNHISILKHKFPDAIIGYSDHTKPENDFCVLSTAYNIGARVIEKHFTLDKTLVGNDHYHAMDTHDIIMIKNKLDYINTICGSNSFEFGEGEIPARNNARRSIVASHDIMAGEVISINDITFKRPAHGISPSNIDMVIGKTAANDILEDSPIYMKDIL